MASVAVLRRLLGALVLGLAEVAFAFGLAAVLTAPLSAQDRQDDRFPFMRHGGPRGGSGFFGGNGGWGGGYDGGRGWRGGRLFSYPTERRAAAPIVENNSKAPPPAKDAAVPLTSVVVLGDSMADWLAYGLEQAAAESPDIGILRRHRSHSGLIRIEVKNESRDEYPDWPQVAREILNADKANFIVVMIGLNDRRPIRDKAAPAKTAKTPAAKAQTAAPASPRAAPADRNKDVEKDSDDAAPADAPAAAVEPERTAPGMVSYEFRSDKWTELYTKRIDAMIAVLKTKNLPVFWVGLPPIRNPNASGDLSYLNDLYRSRAEKAGITYIDTWDGFVDEAGRFVMQGPDFEGQIRRLRSGDGIHFTQPGARKLAHYVEREIQRATMMRVTPVALPAIDEPTPQAPSPARPGNAAIARPLAGPAMPLTAEAEADELLGGASARQIAVDPIAARVLVRGEPVRGPVGRADDFAWPRRSVLPFDTDPVVATTTAPITPMSPNAPETREAAAAPGVGAGGAAAVLAPRRGPAPTRQTATQQRRFAHAPQPFFFPFFGGR
jgi:uncharacterized protein